MHLTLYGSYALLAHLMLHASDPYCMHAQTKHMSHTTCTVAIKVVVWCYKASVTYKHSLKLSNNIA